MKPIPCDRKSLLAIPLILLVGLIVYGNTFSAPFILDDDGSIVKNPVIRSLENYHGNAAGYEASPHRFVAYLSFALNYHFNALEVAGYHAVNLAIHLSSALLVFALLRLTFRTPLFKEGCASGESRGSTPLDASTSILHPATFIPMFAALLFVAHPLQTQAVTYIVQRMTSLATMFYLLSVVLYVLGRLRIEEAGGGSQVSQRKELSGRIKAVSLIAASVSAAIVAMKTKEIAVTLPLAVLLFEVTFFRGAWRRRLAYLLPVLATLPIIPLTVITAGESSGSLLSDLDEHSRVQSELSRAEYLFTQFRVIVTYLRLFILPINQNLDYDYPIYTTFFTPAVFLSFLLLIALFLFGLWLWLGKSNVKRQDSQSICGLAGFGILWFFLTLCVESSIIPITDVIFEHRLYLPSVGVFAAVAAAFCLISMRMVHRASEPIPLLVAVLLVCAFSVATYQRNLVWGDDVRLWQDVVDKSPGKVRAYNNLGVALTQAGRAWEAIEILLEATRLDPLHPHAYNNLGRAYILAGMDAAAVPVLRTAIRLHVEYDDAYINLAAALNKQRRFQEAVSLLERNMHLLAGRAEARYQLGLAYAYLGHSEVARRELIVLSQLNPHLASHLASLLEL